MNILMKLILFILFVSSYIHVSGQSSRRLSSTDYKQKLNIKYIGNSSETGGTLAVVVNDVPLAHTTQFLPMDKHGKIVDRNDLSAQLKQVFDNLATALSVAGSDLDHVVKLNICIVESDLMPKVQEYINRRFKPQKRPVVSFVTGDLILSAAQVAVDAIAVSTLIVQKEVKYLKVPNLFGAPNEVQVSVLPMGGCVYVSGQAAKGDITEATRATLKQLDSTLKYLGLEKTDIVQLKSFICPAADVHLVKKEMSAFFGGLAVPPVVYVEWVSKSPLIEIELIAAHTGGLTKPIKQLDFITPTGMTASPVYSKVTRINYGSRVYFSSGYGQTHSNAKNEVKDVFSSMEKILTEVGSDFNHLAKATYYVVTDSASNALNEIRPKYYKTDRPPAASKAKVKGVGLKGRNICIDMIGVVKEK